MKIGVISDIHADLVALEQALHHIDAHQVNRIVCCGDLVDRGKDGDAVVARIKALDIPTVLGNHDRDAPITQRWIRQHMDVNNPKLADKLLKEETLDFLKTLPHQCRFTWEGFRVLLVHGTIDSIDQYLLPNSPSVTFSQLARQANVDVILSGHTHKPMAIKHKSTWFCNPGSVYRGRHRSSHTFAILTMPERKFQVYEIATGKPITV